MIQDPDKLRWDPVKRVQFDAHHHVVPYVPGEPQHQLHKGCWCKPINEGPSEHQPERERITHRMKSRGNPKGWEGYPRTED